MTTPIIAQMTTRMMTRISIRMSIKMMTQMSTRMSTRMMTPSLSPSNSRLLYTLNLLLRHYSYIRRVFSDSRLRASLTLQCIPVLVAAWLQPHPLRETRARAVQLRAADRDARVVQLRD